MKTDNELIAEFMGWKRFNYPKYKTFILPNEATEHPDYFKFNSSWDWLMPVVEKIESIDDEAHQVEILKTSCLISSDSSDLYINKSWEKHGDTKITFTHKAVVEFIKWYNSQKQL